MRMPGWGRRRLLQALYRRPLFLGDVGPVVSFAFDDFPRTAYTMGGAILRNSGARGTFYTAMGLMNSSNGSGDQFRLDDLHALTADGHELASHTYHHLSSATTVLDTFLEDTRQGQAAIQRIPGLTASKNFAYPFGAVTVAAKRAVGREMLSCRGVLNGVNGRYADLNLLRANGLYGDTNQLDRVRCLFDNAKRLKGWLIFYTHDVQKTPSPHGCTPTLFEWTVRLALKESMRIRTVDEVLKVAIQSQAQPVRAGAGGNQTANVLEEISTNPLQ